MEQWQICNLTSDSLLLCKANNSMLTCFYMHLRCYKTQNRIVLGCNLYSYKRVIYSYKCVSYNLLISAQNFFLRRLPAFSWSSETSPFIPFSSFVYFFPWAEQLSLEKTKQISLYFSLFFLVEVSIRKQSMFISSFYVVVKQSKFVGKTSSGYGLEWFNGQLR